MEQKEEKVNSRRTWKGAAAASAGPSHTAAGTPCQDRTALIQTAGGSPDGGRGRRGRELQGGGDRGGHGGAGSAGRAGKATRGNGRGHSPQGAGSAPERRAGSPRRGPDQVAGGGRTPPVLPHDPPARGARRGDTGHGPRGGRGHCRRPGRRLQAGLAPAAGRIRQ